MEYMCRFCPKNTACNPQKCPTFFRKINLSIAERELERLKKEMDDCRGGGSCDGCLGWAQCLDMLRSAEDRVKRLRSGR